jgi:hypothetical protein
MADFSKQWCDIWDPEMPSDFDIDLIAKDLSREHHYPIICEGLGTISIYKDSHDRIWLGYPKQQKDGSYYKDGTYYKPYHNVLQKEINDRDLEYFPD